MQKSIEIYSDSSLSSVKGKGYIFGLGYILGVTLLMYGYKVNLHLLKKHNKIHKKYNNLNIKSCSEKFTYGKEFNKGIFIKIEGCSINIINKVDNILCRDNLFNNNYGIYYISGYIGAMLIGLNEEKRLKLGKQFQILSKKYKNIDSMYEKYSENKFNFFVIGPSASGKTTFINAVKERNDVNVYNDLIPLKEIFEIDLNVSNLEESDIIFFKKYYMERKRGLVNKYSNYNGDGYDIINPDIWDQILISILNVVDNNTNNLIEFSRGCDIEHIKKYKYKLVDVYLYYFALIENYLKKKENYTKPIFIFLDCGLRKRLFRNSNRKNEGKHYISEKTMKEVYYDSFIPLENNFIVDNNKDYILYKIGNEKDVDIPSNDILFEYEYNRILIFEKLRNFLFNF